jgi:LytS/YehU family sensor histidine kinase
MVPAFLLQPIVENAIKHGIAPFSDAGRIQVRAVRRAGTITIDVRDSGKGSTTGSTGTGHGLDLTRRRLETTYGSRASIDLVHTPGAGMAVTLVLPVDADHV